MTNSMITTNLILILLFMIPLAIACSIRFSCIPQTENAWAYYHARLAPTIFGNKLPSTLNYPRPLTSNWYAFGASTENLTTAPKVSFLEVESPWGREALKENPWGFLPPTRFRYVPSAHILGASQFHVPSLYPVEKA